MAQQSEGIERFVGISEDKLAIIRELRLIDDKFMSWAFDGQIECVEKSLRIILGMPTLKIISMDTQKKIVNLQGRSAIFDVVATDGKRIFNVEVQRQDKGAAPKRARYHSSLIDANTLLSGEEYAKLPETYVIFITETDVLGLGQPIYRIERTIEGTNIKFDDKAHIVYINGAIQDATPLGRLMHDFFCKEAKDMHYDFLRERVKMIKETPEGVSSMCKLLEDMVSEAEANGKANGIVEGIFASILGYIRKKKVSIEVALEDLDVPVSDRPKYAMRLQEALA